jgi:uncharacterized glyoxalase superfamily protein PhnB
MALGRVMKKFIEFYRKAFGAEGIFRIPMPVGKVGHGLESLRA